MPLIGAGVVQLVLEGDAVVLYTCPADTIAQFIACTAVNIDTSDTTSFTIQLGLGAGFVTYILDRDILPKETDLCDEVIGHVLEATQTIFAFASAIADINLLITLEETALLE